MHTHSLLLESQYGKKTAGGCLWERCAGEGRALSVRVLASVFASDRALVCALAWSRGKWFSVREGFYGGFAHIDHKLSSISSRLGRTHTCKQTHTLNNNKAWHTNQTTFFWMRNKRDSDFLEKKLVIFNMLIFFLINFQKWRGKI